MLVFINRRRQVPRSHLSPYSQANSEDDDKDEEREKTSKSVEKSNFGSFKSTAAEFQT
jgi:hypothetical protein